MVESCEIVALAPESVAPSAVFRTPPTIPVARMPHVSETLGVSEVSGEKRSVSGSIEKNVIAQCALHGEYATERLVFAGRMLAKACPKCSVEEEARREAEKEAERLAAMQRFVERSLADSRIPRKFSEATLENWVAVSSAEKRALDVARSFVEAFDGRRAKSLIFYGETGAGKTHLACAVLRALALRGFSAGYTTAADVLMSLRNTWKDANRTETQLLASYERIDLLVIDEVGRTFGGEKEREQMFNFYDRRYLQDRSTILMSNGDLSAMEEALGEVVFDRFKESATVVHFDWPSKRSQKRVA
jgi:DNA replication protein DnaC